MADTLKEARLRKRLELAINYMLDVGVNIERDYPEIAGVGDYADRQEKITPKALESLSDRSLDHICETVNSSPDYSAGKESMRQWFLDNLRPYTLTKQSVDELIEKILTTLDHYAVDGWIQMDTAEDLIVEQMHKHFGEKLP